MPKPNNDRHSDRSEVEWRNPLKCSGEAWSAIVRMLRGWFDFIPLRFIPLTMTITIERDIGIFFDLFWNLFGAWFLEFVILSCGLDFTF